MLIAIPIMLLWTSVSGGFAEDGNRASPRDDMAVIASATMIDQPPLFQVRIEQRIILRVPRRNGRTDVIDMLAPVVPQRETRFRVRKIGKCVVMHDVAGVQVLNDDSLVLFLRDRRLVRAELEKACHARDFYQGFYMVKSEDGRLCADREVLQARSGSKCEIDELRELIPQPPE